jgi:hypothetical protein
LRSRLGTVLYNHILTELPSLLSDVEAGLADCNERLRTLGDSRGTLPEQRLYLLRASQRFDALMTAAVDGNYTDAFFGSSIDDQGYKKRLRAVAVSVLKAFSETMRSKGHAVELVGTLPRDYKHTEGRPKRMTYEDFYVDVKFRMSRNGGRELPGLFNPSIVDDLFFDQAKPWQRIVDGVKDELIDAAHTAVRFVLESVADATTIHGILREIVNPGMERLEQALANKANEVLGPNLKGHAFTLNHYFTENIQRKRLEEDRKNMGKRLFEFLQVDPGEDDASCRQYEGNFDVRHLLEALVKQSELDMDRFAAIECVNAMLSYYKVSDLVPYVVSD